LKFKPLIGIAAFAHIEVVFLRIRDLRLEIRVQHVKVFNDPAHVGLTSDESNWSAFLALHPALELAFKFGPVDDFSAPTPSNLKKS
jgi:hypothetical protein